jgi:hypothetical protein
LKQERQNPDPNQHENDTDSQQWMIVTKTKIRTLLIKKMGTMEDVKKAFSLKDD